MIPSRTDPILLQLEADYKAFGGPALSAWRDHQNNIGIEQFRGDGAYLAQANDEKRHWLQYDYIRMIDKNGWLDKLDEDGAFGCRTYKFGDKVVSRDLMDSVMELYFVYETLGHHTPHRWLDIGAGYGRLAHRYVTLYSDSQFVCMDAVPVSTYLCSFYMNYRKLNQQCDVIPLNIVSCCFTPDDYGGIDIASNIHSWSEASIDSINWWLDHLVEWQIPYLFVVPHDSRFVAVNADGSIGYFRPLLEQHGYKLIHERPKYLDGRQGLHDEALYTLWRLT